MNTNYLINSLSKKNNGAFFKISYITDVPMTAQAKRDGNVVIKYTTTTVRKEIDYDKMKSVQAKVEQGKVLTHELPWGHWMAGHEGLLIEHKDKIYVRLYNSPNKPKSDFFLNGKLIEKEKLKTLGLVLNSYWNKNEAFDCITVNTGNIQEIF